MVMLVTLQSPAELSGSTQPRSRASRLGAARVGAALGFLVLAGSLPPGAPDLAFSKAFLILFTSPDVICYQTLAVPLSLQTGVFHRVRGNVRGCCE